jgi:hypothetical protein
MQRRAVLSLINIGVAAVALLVFFLFPRYATYAIYAFLGWFLVSLVTVWVARGASPMPGPPTPGAVAAAAGAPAAATAPARRTAPAAPTAPAPIGFCIYCATDLPPGADRCPACGHTGARLS